MPAFDLEYRIEGKIRIHARDYETAVDIFNDMSYSDITQTANEPEITGYEEGYPDEDDR